jgi:hypothetical protein
MKWRLRVLAGIVLAFSTFSTRADGTHIVTVQANVDGWQDSGVSVVAGQTLVVMATGLTHPDEFSYTDANAVGGSANGPFPGYGTEPGSIAPTTVYCSLIGKVGGDANVGTGILLPESAPGKGPGFVGTPYEQVIPNSGELFFAYNDAINFADNTGAYTVTFSVPEPTSILPLAMLGMVICRSRRRSRLD